MVDGVVLLVDASEGPLPQTRFVLRKALERRLAPVVVINKIDRPDARAAGSAERDLRPVHRSRRDRGADRLSGALHQRARRHGQPSSRRGRARICGRCSTRSSSTCRRRGATPTAPLQLLVANLDSSDYLGRIAIGRIFNGRVKVGDPVVGHASSMAVSRRRRSPSCSRSTGCKRVDIAGSRRRRHRLPGRHRGHHDRRDGRRPRAPRRDPADRDRRADRLDDLRRQHVAAGRPRRAVRHLAQPARPARHASCSATSRSASRTPTRPSS